MEQDEIGKDHSFNQLRTVDLYLFESKLTYICILKLSSLNFAYESDPRLVNGLSYI